MIHITLAEKLIPQMGTPGDIFIPKDCRRIHFVGSNGKTVDITAVLDGDIIHGVTVALVKEITDLKASLDDLLAHNASGREYVESLRAKAAARKK
jgi:hypothetical protein